MSERKLGHPLALADHQPNLEGDSVYTRRGVPPRKVNFRFDAHLSLKLNPQLLLGFSFLTGLDNAALPASRTNAR